MPPAFDDLSASQETISLEKLEAMTVGSFVALLFREKVTDEWQRVVLERTSKDDFAIYNEAGTDQLDTVPFGLDED
eukprot:4417169-Pleurochrysis_carterae.AAC.1